MTMQRRHYEFIAAVLKEAMENYDHPNGVGGKQTTKEISSRMARHLADTNPSFDRARFLRACGVQS